MQASVHQQSLREEVVPAPPQVCPGDPGLTDSRLTVAIAGPQLLLEVTMVTKIDLEINSPLNTGGKESSFNTFFYLHVHSLE